MIKGSIVGGTELTTRVKGFDPKLRSALTKIITRLTVKLLRNVKADKLTGQALNVRSGRLRRSINMRIDGADTAKVSGAVGTNLRYGRAHEYGFSGTVSVKESMRMVKQAFGRSITPTQVTVRAHSMKMNLPERSFLRSALAEMGPEIEAELRSGVQEALK